MSFQTSRRAFLAGTATTIGGVFLAACGQVATTSEMMEEKPAEPKEEAKAVEEPVAEQVTIQFLWPPYSPAKERWHDRLVDAYMEEEPQYNYLHDSRYGARRSHWHECRRRRRPA